MTIADIIRQGLTKKITVVTDIKMVDPGYGYPSGSAAVPSPVFGQTEVVDPEKLAKFLAKHVKPNVESLVTDHEVEL